MVVEYPGLDRGVVSIVSLTERDPAYRLIPLLTDLRKAKLLASTSSCAPDLSAEPAAPHEVVEDRAALAQKIRDHLSKGENKNSSSRVTWIPPIVGDHVTLYSSRHAGEVGVVHSVSTLGDRVVVDSFPDSKCKWSCIVPILEIQLDNRVKIERLSSVM